MDKTPTPFQRVGLAQVVDVGPQNQAPTPQGAPKDLAQALAAAKQAQAQAQQQPDPTQVPAPPAPNIDEMPEFKALKEQQEKEIQEAKEAFKQATQALNAANLAQERAKEAFKITQAEAQDLVTQAKAQLEKAQELQKNAQEALEVAKFVEPKGLKNLPAVPILGDGPIFKDLAPNVPTPIEIEADFLALLEKSLDEQKAWKEQIYLCLQGVSRILMAFKGLKGFYENAQVALADAGNALESKSAFFNAQIDFLTQLLNDYNRYFDEFNAVMNENNALINQNFNVVLDQIALVKKLLGRASAEGKALLGLQKSIELLLNKLNNMEDIKNQLLELNNKSRAFIEELQRLIKEAITSIQEQQDQALNHINTQEQESTTKLLALQTQIEEALNRLEEESIEHLRDELARIESQIEKFNTDYEKKFEEIQAHVREVVKIRDFLNALEKALMAQADQKIVAMENIGQTQLDAYNDNAEKQTRIFNTNARRLEQGYTDKANQLKDQYSHNAAQLQQDFNANAQARLQDHNTHSAQQLGKIAQRGNDLLLEFNTNAQAKLDGYNANDQQKTLDYNTNAQAKLGEYDDNVADKIADFDNHAHEKTAQSQITIENLADDLIAKMAIAGTPLHTELGGIHTLLEQLRQKQHKFGANFQVIEVATNQQWNAPVDGIYYYIFIQGGNSAMGSNANGGVTSFGALLSANGGFNGQRGECKAGWFELTAGSTHNITVGSGGICVISYATRI
ncbi:hypothetical protein [Helicobacter mehlei]|uniref:hypothetical protein n=1 Tax=Helicobacter mehlei TaxID=2316080 RepID=UPI000EB167A1|nr:hypothetical protein [Helicobacter mehlei]